MRLSEGLKPLVEHRESSLSLVEQRLLLSAAMWETAPGLEIGHGGFRESVQVSHPVEDRGPGVHRTGWHGDPKLAEALALVE